MKKQKTPIIIKDNINEHPAVLAWSQLKAGLPKPEAIEVIRSAEKSKRPVLRLVGVGINGSSVIAKKTKRTNAMTERCIYENVLNYLSRGTLYYYGDVEVADQRYWIFIEDVRGNPFSFENVEHVSLATNWFAELHTCVPKLDCLPDRGLEYYYSHLISANNTILLNYSNSALRDGDRNLLKSIIISFDYLMHHWETVRGLYKQMPKGMIHGDFKTKNLQVRRDSHGVSLVVFDWEDSGWGLPGIDMWRLNHKDYWIKVRDHWRDISFEHVMQLSNLGKLFWCLAAIDWVAVNLAYQWIEKPMERLMFYKSNLDSAIKEILLC